MVAEVDKGARMVCEERAVVRQTDRVDEAVLDALGEQAEPVLLRIELIRVTELLVVDIDVGR